jgi:uncharacterized membrane protein
MRVEVSVEIERPLRDVFSYVSDVANYPEWMAHALEVRKNTDGAPQESDRFVVALKSVGRRFETPYQRTAYEANRGYTDHAAGGPIPDHRWHSTFQELPRGTRLTRAVDVEARGVAKLLELLQRRAAERQLEKDLLTLKGALEGRQAI